MGKICGKTMGLQPWIMGLTMITIMNHRGLPWLQPSIMRVYEVYHDTTMHHRSKGLTMVLTTLFLAFKKGLTRLLPFKWKAAIAFIVTSCVTRMGRVFRPAVDLLDSKLRRDKQNWSFLGSIYWLVSTDPWPYSWYNPQYSCWWLSHWLLPLAEIYYVMVYKKKNNH